MSRRLPQIKIPRHSASVFYGDRHKFVLPIPRVSFALSLSREKERRFSLSLPFCSSRLLAQIYGLIDSSSFRKPPWNFAEVEFRPDHRPSPPPVRLAFYSLRYPLPHSAILNIHFIVLTVNTSLNICLLLIYIIRMEQGDGPLRLHRSNSRVLTYNKHTHAHVHHIFNLI